MNPVRYNITKVIREDLKKICAMNVSPGRNSKIILSMETQRDLETAMLVFSSKSETTKDTPKELTKDYPE